MGCALSALSIMAQNSSFLELQTVIPTVSGAKPDLQLNAGFLHHIDSHLKWGMGVGVMENTQFKFAPSVPVFTRLEFDFIDYGDYRPFLSVDLGYRANFEDFEDGSSVFVNPTLGVNLYRCYLGVGYFGSMATSKNAEWANAISIRIGARFGDYDGSGNGHLHMPRPIKNFFKHSSFGIHATYGYGLGTTTIERKNENEETEYSLPSRYGAGLTWMYNFNDNWAFGLGATYTIEYKTEETRTYYYYDGKTTQEHKYDFDDSSWDLDYFCRLQYTMDEIGSSSIKPYVSADLGLCRQGESYFYAGQIGIKAWDWLKIGASCSVENNFLGTDSYFGYRNANCLNFILGVEF